MTFEDNLKAQFAAVSPPPSRLTSSDAVRLGRRSQRTYRLATSGITAGLVIATVCVTAWGATTHPSTTVPSQKRGTHPQQHPHSRPRAALPLVWAPITCRQQPSPTHRTRRRVR